MSLDLDAPSALRLSREADPDGKYLMAAVLVPGTGAIPNRRAFLDTARFDAVLGVIELARAEAADVTEDLAAWVEERLVARRDARGRLALGL